MAITEEDKILAVKEVQRIRTEYQHKQRQSLIERIFRCKGNKRFSTNELTFPPPTHRQIVTDLKIVGLSFLSLSALQIGLIHYDLLINPTFNHYADIFLRSDQETLAVSFFESIAVASSISELRSNLLGKYKPKL